MEVMEPTFTHADALAAKSIAQALAFRLHNCSPSHPLLPNMLKEIHKINRDLNIAIRKLKIAARRY
jgi:hypothetical protein